MNGLGQSFYDDGQESKAEEIVKNLVLRGRDTEEEIAQIVNLPVEQVMHIKELMIRDFEELKVFDEINCK